MTAWVRFAERLLHAWALLTVEAIDFLWGIGDLPDDRPAIPDCVDYEYFDLLEREGRR